MEGSGDPKKASLIRGQRPWASVMTPGFRWHQCCQLVRRLTFPKSNRKPWKAIEFWARAWNNLLVLFNWFINHKTLFFLLFFPQTYSSNSFSVLWKTDKQTGNSWARILDRRSLSNIKSLGQLQSWFSNLFYLSSLDLHVGWNRLLKCTERVEGEGNWFHFSLFFSQSTMLHSLAVLLLI